MNASGRPNTCKSRGNDVFGQATTGARVSIAFVTYLKLEDSPKKFGLIFHNTIVWHHFIVKAPAV